jgi:hypothetical protein
MLALFQDKSAVKGTCFATVEDMQKLWPTIVSKRALKHDSDVGKSVYTPTESTSEDITNHNWYV